MNHIALVAAACAVACGAVPAGAATIVQTANEHSQIPVDSFKSSLGTLTDVSLRVVGSKARTYQVISATGAPDRITYSVDGLYNVRAPAYTGGGSAPLTGSGSVDVTFGDPGFMGLYYAQFDTPVFVDATISLDPDLFIDRYQITIDGQDPYFYSGPDVALDTTLTSQNGNSVRKLAGYCYGGPFTGEDFCGFTAYTLTYTYTPAVAQAPEPATWAMMIAGFGAIGGTLRHRRRGHRVACA